MANSGKSRISILDPYRERKTHVEVPSDVPLSRLVPALVRSLGLPTTSDDGRPIEYVLESEDRTLSKSQTLLDAGIQNDTQLALHAVMTAGCFVAGTQITLLEGDKKPVENIQIGDVVVSHDLNSGALTVDTVVGVFIEEVDEYVVINDTLRVSTSNYIYANESWVPVSTLRLGDQLYSVDLAFAEVQTLHKIKQRTTVYNFRLKTNGYAFFADQFLVYGISEVLETPNLGENNVSLTETSDRERLVALQKTPILSESQRPVLGSSTSQPQGLDEVRFSGYYPREARAGSRYGMHMYAHLENELRAISDDVQKFTDELGGEVPNVRTSKDIARVAQGTKLTVIPRVEGLEFDPPEITKKWDAPWVRYSFDFKPSAESIGETLTGYVSLFLCGIEIARMTVAIEIVSAERQQLAMATSDNPLTHEVYSSSTVRLYNKIFVSYSHKDTEVVENYRLAQMALGNDVFMDTYSIRAGENWRTALARAIDSADIFQLFWSENAAQSSYVKYEWDYALQQKCSADKCEEFIRPVFWQKPIPDPPQDLEHLQFTYVPFANAK